VRVRYLSPAPLNGDDSLERTTLAKQPWAPHVVRDKQAHAAPAPHSGPAPKASFLAAATVTVDPPLVTKKGSFEKTPKDSAGGWMTNAEAH
jgi:hypothetical protein